MDKNLYSIYDKKSGTYMQPFVDLTDGTATRQCIDLLSNTNSPFSKFPEDFTLMRIGSWDEIGGIPTADNPPEVVIELLTLQQAKE
jgi:hypothetical protein